MKINFSIVLALTSVSAGLTTGAISVNVTDTNGNAHSKVISASDFSTLGTVDGDKLTLPVVFEDSDGVPFGPITGSVQTLDQNSVNLGDAVSYSYSPVVVDNKQFVAASVTVTIG